ncbi:MULTISPECIES: alpha/beta fold hydrolase [Moorena]|uniref:Acyl transferase domain protein n=1 Tax=Moorena producens 3L TaxID=489825 RepID=F4XZI7_9CYAN|nr:MULTISPECIES: alpha/beta fold hydrolase [Moorena]NEQ12854.1 acyltransferase domain-containing protein [Moorena sp. SIO3E2]EGJ29992.1 acyl transferase domain protein [Moorena producens 3L]NEP64383.1 acyltransferase domain-containing protein [Moorena sp. SIO3A5]NER88714.1 acyltransferase domain-containing protein [Moorena sp. SIO3A2]NES43312.1 acyltransferase domain-containing protein [Moorena sp. SIO2C4]
MAPASNLISNWEIRDVLEPSTRQPQQLPKQLPKQLLINGQQPKLQPVAFMFPGQGAQYVNMGLELIHEISTFRDLIDRCSELLKPHLGIDLRHVLYPKQEQTNQATEQLKQTTITQPAMFVIEYALAQLWMSWGVSPQAMIGHSIGEYVAACVAGVFSLEDALSLVALRGQMMQQLPGGSMLAVPLPEQELQSLLGQELSLAVINGPSQSVISGPTDAIALLQNQLDQQGLEYRRLHTSHAFHSKMMEPILDSFTNQVKQVSLNPPQIPYLSNVTGTWITAEQAVNPGYWAQHLRQTVRFSQGVQQLLKQPETILLEVGPGRTLSTLTKRHSQKAVEQLVLTSVRHPRQEQSDLSFLLTTVEQLREAGVSVDWDGCYGQTPDQQDIPRHKGQEEDAQKDNSTLVAPDQPQPDSSNTFVAPRDDLERQLTKIWENVLGIKSISVTDNFYDLGGDSLLAVRLFAEIEKVFQKKLPLASLLMAPTVAQLVNQLRQDQGAAPWSSVVSIQPNGSKPPLFCIHGAGGNVLSFRDLAHYLGSEQPFYGLQSLGLDGKQTPLTTVEDMARCYLQEIRSIQPKGPYFLSGYCFGSKIALEIAQLLRLDGDTVALLALLEPSPLEFSTSEKQLPYKRSYSDRLKGLFQRLIHRGFQDVIKQQFLKLVSKLYQSFGISLPQSLQIIKVQEANTFASKNYVAKRYYPNPVTMFLTSERIAQSPELQKGWIDLVTGNLEIQEISGKHLDDQPGSFLKDPHVELLAQKIRACID